MSPPLLPQDITMTETEETVLDPRSLVKALLQAHDDWSGAAGTPLYGEAADALNKAEAAVVAALSRAPKAGREGAAERLAIVAEKPAHLIRWGEGDRLDLQSVLAALSPPSTGGEGDVTAQDIANMIFEGVWPRGEVIDGVMTTVWEGLDETAALILSKLKENGLSREELGGLARSQPGAAGPSDCAEGDARLSDGGEA